MEAPPSRCSRSAVASRSRSDRSFGSFGTFEAFRTIRVPRDPMIRSCYARNMLRNHLICLTILLTSIIAVPAAAQNRPVAGGAAVGGDIGVFFPDEVFEKTFN